MLCFPTVSVQPCCLKSDPFVLPPLIAILPCCWGYGGARRKFFFSVILARLIVSVPASSGSSIVVGASKRGAFDLSRRDQCHRCCLIVRDFREKLVFVLPVLLLFFSSFWSIAVSFLFIPPFSMLSWNWCGYPMVS